MNPILRNFIIEATVVLLLGVAIAFRVGPVGALLPVVVVVGIAAIVNAVILVRGPSSGDGVVRRTDDTDRDGNPVHGSEIMLADGRKTEVKWSDITPNGIKINELPEGARVRVSYWKRPVGGDIIEDVAVLS